MVDILKMAGGIIVAILAFGVMIFVHELGHFIAAKRSNVKVNEFALGMGPTLWKRTKGETTYALRAIPFGGFVAMEGENDESEDNRSFGNASLLRRGVIMVAGACMNLIMGVLILFIIAATTPMYGTTMIGELPADANSAQWLEQGDKILRVNGKKTSSFNDVVYQLIRSQDGVLDLVVERGDKQVVLDDVQFDMVEVQEGVNVIQLDFKFQAEKRTFGGVFKETASQTKRVSKTVWSSLFDLVTGKVGINQLSGPVGITKEIGTLSSSGDWLTVANFVAMISINLGLLNLFPFPALDGGRLVLLVVEAVRGKKINQNVEMYINAAGLLLLLGLMAIVTLKDILKLF